jgi:cobalt/nickel transport system permease protein
MHIPDGYLSPQTYVPLYVASFVFWTIALKKLKRDLSVKHIPYLAMAAVFSFLIQMFHIPIPGGTTGHVVGAGIIAIILGPWAAVIAVSIVLIIQAVVFGGGGITAIGANCFSVAVVMPFTSYWVFKLIKRAAEQKSRRAEAKKLTGNIIAGFLSGYIGLSVSAIFTAVILGIQPLIAAAPDGRPLYAPYPLSITIPVIVLGHLLLFGVVEGIVTVLLLKYFLKHKPDLVRATGRVPRKSQTFWGRAQ